VQQHRQVCGEPPPPQQVEQCRQHRDWISDLHGSGHERPSLGENLDQLRRDPRHIVTRLPVAGQPLQVDHKDLIWGIDQPVLPADQPAGVCGGLERHLVCRLDHPAGAAIDHRPTTIGKPGEPARSMRTVPVVVLRPQQLEWSRRKRYDLRVVVQQHHLVAVGPRPIRNMTAVRR